MNAYEYADLIDRLLNTCQFLENPPHFASEFQIKADNDFVWRDSIPFQDGHMLHIEDRVLFDSNGSMAYRLFTYVFVRRPDEIVFRIDTHGIYEDIYGACHVHWGSEGNIAEFPSWEGIDFSYVIRCIKRHYIGSPQEWECKE